MRAARIAAFNKPYSVEDVPVPSLGPKDVLIKIAAAGLCHTDLQVLEGVYESAGAKPGLIGSHEPCGTIAAVGAKAEGQFKLGDRVGTINTYGYCGKCEACKGGKMQLCDSLGGMCGVTIDGGFAQYMKADARVVTALPDSIPFEEAAPLFCAGATIYGAMCAVDPRPGQVVAVVGIGGLGHLGVQYVKARGCKVVAIDNRKEGVELVESAPEHLRPDKSYVIDSERAENEVAQELSTSFYESNPGVDKVMIAAEAPHLIRWSQRFLRKGGELVDVGLPSDAPFEVDPFSMNFKEHTIKGRLICSPQQSREMIKLHHDNRCRVHVEKTYAIDHVNDMLDHYRRKDLKGRLCMVF